MPDSSMDALASIKPRSLDALAEPLTWDALPDDLIVDGAPETGFTDLARLRASTVGLWEHSVGTSRDVEVEELSLVIAGRGTVQINDEPAVELRPGVLLRLHDGDRTVWTISEALRKLYLLIDED